VSPNADRDRLQILSHSTLYTSLDPHGYAIMRFAPVRVMTRFGCAKLFGDRFFGRLAVRARSSYAAACGHAVPRTVGDPGDGDNASPFRLSVVSRQIRGVAADRAARRRTVFHRSAGGQRILGPMVVPSPEAIRLSQPARRDDVPTFSATLTIVFEDASSRRLEISSKPRFLAQVTCEAS
jgi:hypothetical protein